MVGVDGLASICARAHATIMLILAGLDRRKSIARQRTFLHFGLTAIGLTSVAQRL